MKQRLNIVGWQDFLELALATWIVLSPFVLGYFDVVNASLSIMLTGSVIIFFAIMGMATENPLDEWINLCLGLFLVATPWLFGFSALAAATLNSVICGGVLVTLTILAMVHDYHEINEAKLAKES